MDWADDVAYSVHDVEDGVHGGLIRLADGGRRRSRAAVRDRRRAVLAAAGRPSSRRCWTRCWRCRRCANSPATTARTAAQAAAKRATSELTGRFVGAAVDGDPGRSTATARSARYAGRPGGARPDVAAECALLKAIAAHYVMRRPGAAERQAAQRRLLTELVGAVLDGAPACSIGASWRHGSRRR